MIRTLTPADLKAAVDLSTEAGWNQLRSDWERLLDLAPEGCFGYWQDGALVATCTVITYGGELSWIGMMLVRRSHRRRGLGRAMFERALDVAGPTVVGLDATEYGRPLYQQYGFEDIEPITRWGGRLRIAESPTTNQSSPLDDILVHDEQVTGIDRRTLLKRLAADGRMVVSGDGSSYAFLRQGRTAWQIGPIVATGEDVLHELLAKASIFTGDAKVVIDVIGPAVRREDATAVLERVGLTPDRLLVRMLTDRTDSIFTDRRILAAAGLELG